MAKLRTGEYKSEFWLTNYIGFVILLSLCIGGGTVQGIWTDYVIQMFMLPLIFFGLCGLWRNHFSNLVNLLSVATMILLFTQFLPIANFSTLPSPPSEFPTGGWWSLSPGRSLESAAFFMCLLGLCFSVARLSALSQLRLFRYIFLGLSINIIAVVIQLSFSGGTRVEGVLPFVLTAALFANENHFSTLVFSTIPLFAWQLLSRNSSIGSYVFISIILVAVLFAVGSRAGMALSLYISLLCLGWFLLINRPVKYRLFLLAGAVLFALAAFSQLGIHGELLEERRALFFRNSWSAIKDHWMTGTGIGTFPIVYPFYEPLVDMVRAYANHAHNDYLEIAMETGVFGAVLLSCFIALVVKNIFNSSLSEAATLGIISILIHSIVDYPLRTFAIGVVFAVYTAVVFSNKKTGELEKQLE